MPRSTPRRCASCCARDAADHRVRRHQPPAAADATAGHPPADHRSGPHPGRGSRRRRRRADLANALHRRMTAVRDSPHRRRAGLPVVLARPAQQPRRRGRRQPAPRRPHRRRRRRRDQQAGRRERPAGLRQRQPGGDGRRPQVGPIGLASYKSLRHHHNSHTMVHSRSFMDPEKSAHALFGLADGPAAGRVRQDFQIETTLNNQAFPTSMGFLTKREWEWSARDQAMRSAPCAASTECPRGCGDDRSSGWKPITG